MRESDISHVIVIDFEGIPDERPVLLESFSRAATSSTKSCWILPFVMLHVA